MPTLSVGNLSSPRRSRRGITLIEMMLVVMVIGLIAGVSFPAVSSGLETIRLSGAADEIAGALNGALNRADRRQEAVEIQFHPKQGELRVISDSIDRTTKLPEGVRMTRVIPENGFDPELPRVFVVVPGGTPPHIAVEVATQKGLKRIVRVDPITGVPNIER